MKILNDGFEMVPVERLHEDEHNARQGDTGAIYESIESNGFYGVIVAQKSSGRIIAGNHRFRAAIKHGAADIPVVWLDCSDSVARRIALADNRTADLASWDEPALASLLKELATSGEGLSGTAFDGDALDNLLSDLGEAPFYGKPQEEAPEPEIDNAAELQKKWKTARGQIWEIPSKSGSGAHRLMCGDSTDIEQVRALMQGRQAGLMNTDPPYGVSYANDERPNPGVAKPRVAKDDLRDEKLQAFLEKAFSAAKVALLENAAWYLWHAHLTQGFFAAAAAAAAADVILHRQIIWVKPVLLLGRGQYHWKHEPCFMGWVEGHQPPDFGRGHGERDQTTIWEIAHVTQAERKEFNHSTPKPAELFEIPITKHLEAGAICYEPFAGSGPQFVAAERKGVLCYGTEIEPSYCAVILERMVAMNLEPRLIERTEPLPHRDSSHRKTSSRGTSRSDGPVSSSPRLVTRAKAPKKKSRAA